MSSFSINATRPTEMLEGTVTHEDGIVTILHKRPRSSKMLRSDFPLNQVASAATGEEGYVAFYVPAANIDTIVGEVEDLGTHLSVTNEDGVEYIVDKAATTAEPVEEDEAPAKPAAKKKAAAKPEAAPAKTKKVKEVEPEEEEEEEEEAPVAKKGKKAKAEEKPAAKPKKAAKADDFDDEDF